MDDQSVALKYIPNHFSYRAKRAATILVSQRDLLLSGYGTDNFETKSNPNDILTEIDTKVEKKLPPYMLIKKFFCMNEDRRLKLDKFETYQDAMAATKKLVDKFLLEHYAPGMISHGTLRR